MELVQLSKKDLKAIVELEKASWIPPLQAASSTILKRFNLGHIMLGSVDEKRLVGIVSISYTRFSPKNKSKFPKTFKEFSSRPSVENPNAAFAYNLNVLPKYRNKGVFDFLIENTELRIKKDRISHLFWDARIASYAGSSKYRQEKRPAHEEFRKAFDRWIRTGRKPSDKELSKDPLLHAYHSKVKNSKFWTARADFLPADVPSGGHRVIMHKKFA